MKIYIWLAVWRAAAVALRNVYFLVTAVGLTLQQILFLWGNRVIKKWKSVFPALAQKLKFQYSCYRKSSKMPITFFGMLECLNTLLSFSEPSSRVHKVLKSNGKLLCLLFIDQVLLHFVEQVKMDLFPPIAFPKHIMGCGGSVQENKMLVFKSNICFPHLGSAPVNILATDNWTHSLGRCEELPVSYPCCKIRTSSATHAVAVLSEPYSPFAQLLLHLIPFLEFIIGILL